MLLGGTDGKIMRGLRISPQPCPIDTSDSFEDAEYLIIPDAEFRSPLVIATHHV